MLKSEKLRRLVSGHDSDGRAVFPSVDQIEPTLIKTGEAAMSTIWTAGEVPVELNGETEGRDRNAGLNLDGGSAIRVCDMMPSGESPCHRTNSIDYGIVLHGQVELEVDDGATEICNPGLLLIQQTQIDPASQG